MTQKLLILNLFAEFWINFWSIELTRVTYKILIKNKICNSCNDVRNSL